MPDFLDTTDDGLLAFATPFSAAITLAPTSYGLVVGNATLLATKVSTYATDLAAAQNPATRGGSTVNSKNISKADLISYIRQLARAIQGTLTVTDEQRFDLGLTVRDTEPTPIAPPANAPQVLIEAISGNRVTTRMIDPANPTRRGKPPAVAGLALFSFVGDEAPQTEAGWRFEGNSTVTKVDVMFPASTPAGAKVWFTAFWRNAKDQSGPAATPVSTNIAGGSAMAA